MKARLELPVFQLPEELRDEFRILPFGEHTSQDGQIIFRFDPADAQTVLAAFSVRGIELLTDWEHQSIAHLPGFEMFKAPDGRAPAAAWAARLEARADGLWAAKVRWTPEAKTAIETGAYRYQSPVLGINPETGRVTWIQSVALTNEPRINRIPALAARVDLGQLFSTGKESSMGLKEQMVEALGLPASATDQDICTAAKDFRTKAANASTEVTAFKTGAETEKAQRIEAEKQRDTAQAQATQAAQDLQAFKTTTASERATEKAALVEAVLDAAEVTGRIAPAQREHWKTIVAKDPVAGLSAFKAIPAGSVVPVGRVTQPAAQATDKAAVDPADPLAACKSDTMDPERMELHKKVLEYQKGHPNTSYAQALEAVASA